MKILALETSTEACSVALWNAGHSIERYQFAPRRHTELILPMVQAILAEAAYTLAQLDAIAFGCGPGSFTGLRIAASVAQGLSFAAGLPVVPISTLLALAQGAYREFGHAQIAVALDARMQQIYFGAYQYQADAMQAMIEETLIKPAAMVLPPKMTAGWGIGEAWQVYATVVHEQAQRLAGITVDYYPHAKYIAELAAIAYQQGQAVAPQEALPHYLHEQIV